MLPDGCALLVQRFNGWLPRLPRWTHRPAGHLVSAMGLVFGAALNLGPHPPRKFSRRVRSEDVSRGKPWRPLRSNKSVRIFTHDEWGDYLIWSLYPSSKGLRGRP